jgi:hypothetical protein
MSAGQKVHDVVGYKFKGKSYHPVCIVKVLNLPAVTDQEGAEHEIATWGMATFDWDIDAEEWDDHEHFPQWKHTHDSNCVPCDHCHEGLLDGQ